MSLEKKGNASRTRPNPDSSLQLVIMHLHILWQTRFYWSRPEPLLASSRLAQDYIHNELERPKQLSNFDLCLKATDGDWHLPLIFRARAHATRNLRTRSQGSQAKRHSEMFPVDMADKPARDQERMTTDNTVRIQDHLDLKIMAGMDTATINRQYGS